MTCPHLTLVPVMHLGSLVASLCRDCDEQQPAEAWIEHNDRLIESATA